MLRNWSAFDSSVCAWMVSDCLVFFSEPIGVLALAAVIAACTSSTPMPRAASASGFNCTRTAYFWLPNTCTWATPSMVDSAGEMTCCAKASMSWSGAISLLNVSSRIGASAGLTLR